jgi:hypothetical protein
MRKIRLRWVVLLGVLFIGVVMFWLANLGTWGSQWAGSQLKHPRSVNLTEDLRLMWETIPLGGDAGPNAGLKPQVSSDRAMAAAVRVFNTIDIIGKTSQEVVTILGDPQQSSPSVYNFPFYPTPEAAIVYRFENGCYGCQFNIIFDRKGGRVVKVDYYPID